MRQFIEQAAVASNELMFSLNNFSLQALPVPKSVPQVVCVWVQQRFPSIKTRGTQILLAQTVHITYGKV